MGPAIEPIPARLEIGFAEAWRGNYSDRRSSQRWPQKGRYSEARGARRESSRTSALKKPVLGAEPRGNVQPERKVSNILPRAFRLPIMSLANDSSCGGGT